MRSSTASALLVLAICAGTASVQAHPKTPPLAQAHAAIRYGSNLAASGTFVRDGVKFYYEVYGKGEPLLFIHGNGGSISDWASQIAHFGAHYRVIAMDSRDQGRSGDSAGPITYEQMADDQAALLDHLGISQANIVGWSDGGIEALLLGMRHRSKVKKIVAMAANLNPNAVYPETAALADAMTKQANASGMTGAEAVRGQKLVTLLANEPHIDAKMLNGVAAPVLVLAGDHDLILDTHTLEIFHNLPNGQLGIIPDSTHMVPFDDPGRFNATVERFLERPFVKKDRIADFLKSYGAMKASKE